MTSSPPIVAADDPIGLFTDWLNAAAAREALAEVASVATATADGKPSLRMVLVKAWDQRGFVFYTNTLSRKGAELGENPHAALCLYWKSFLRQVRIEGPITFVTETEANAYFESRPRDSQIAAWASLQSEDLPDRSVLLKRFEAATVQYDGRSVPRPPHWSGYRVRPDVIEFWEDVPDRMHDRLVYCRTADGGWQTQRLYP